MKTNKLLIAALLPLAVIFTACEEDIADDVITRSTTMTGAQEVPAITTSGTAALNYTYNKKTKTLTYSVVWSNMTDSTTAMHIHGLALRGQSAGVLQSFTLSTVQRRKEGTYTGNLYIEEQTFKEADLLAGRYYLNLHTKAFPGGEVRGQLEF
jgi:FtsP/CotA-like multicopper oxidase with cupredoxin domain